MTEGVDDLVLCSSLSNGEITNQLKARLEREKIYTNIGDVLVSVNPFRRLPIYGDDHIRMYQSGSGAEVPPHIYALAETAYRRMCGDGESQAVIISGESGAGKTECAKLILNYVSAVSGGGGQGQDVKHKILQTNPILESFGNARTVRNDNSSRFGKYLEVMFGQDGAPVGARISNFLLEKTRVAFQGKKERNFHIFYQLLCGADAQMKQEFGLDGGPQSFFYVSQSGFYQIEHVDDAAEFQQTSQAFRDMGFSNDEIWYFIFQTLAGILHLGNCTFQGDAPAKCANRNALEYAAWLFSLEPQTLEQALNHRTIQTGSRKASMYFVPQNADQCAGIRDALAKSIYSRLFDFIVYRLNGSLATRSGGMLIGVLDIYGFEVFDHNSFEQICIDYVNERLQQIFIDLILRSEQEEYHNEGLKWKDISYFDNKKICDLMEGRQPVGIFRVLDDSCRSAHAVDSDTMDQKFFERLVGVYKQTPHPHLALHPFPNFTVKHYAGEVTYDVTEWGFKNTDSLFPSLIMCMQTSSVPFITQLFPENMQNNKAAPTTAGFKIRQSASDLVKALRQYCVPHYIRCIKSNDKRAALTFNTSRCEHQVKYLGLLENVKVKRSGFAYRHYYDTFLNRFACIMDQPPQQGGRAGVEQLAKWCGRNIPELEADEFAFGNTKVFLKSPEVLFQLEEFRFKKQDPEGYKEREKTYRESERKAKAQQGRHSHKSKCSLM